MYKAATNEGIDRITGLEYNIDDVSGFVNITKFDTQREENVATTQVHDMRDALKKKPSMKLMFY
jgi:hypothetical protein